MKESSEIFWRSLLFNLAFYSWTGLVALFCLPLLLSLRYSMLPGQLWAQGSLWLAASICGIRHEVRGLQYVSEHGVIYASKHQSAWDTVIFWIMFRAPAYVLKKELLRLPLFGFYLIRQEQIAIDRKAGASAIKSLIRQCRQRLWERRPVILFPEGTRTVPGAAPVYQPGIGAVYSQLKVPVIPVALNSGLCWGRKAFLKKPGTIVLEFLPPIEPGLPTKEFLARLQNSIESASAKLLEEGCGKKDETMLYFHRKQA
jgi:1-acyl-sn-glycerol-3-phosphate acyltransferase